MADRKLSPPEEILLARDKTRKLSMYWSGPWTVYADPINEVMVRFAPCVEWKKGPTQVVSIDRLKIFVESQQPVQPPMNTDLSMPGDEFAEYTSPDRDLRADP